MTPMNLNLEQTLRDSIRAVEANRASGQVVPTDIQLPKGTLYEITDHLQALFDTVDLVEASDERAQIDQEIARYLEAEIRRVDRIAGYLAHCEAQVKAAIDEIKRLQQRKSTYEKRFERVKQSAIAVMDRLNVKKLEGRTNTLSLRRCPDSVEILNENLIPDEFKTAHIEITVNKAEVKAELQAKRNIPGVCLVTGKKTLVRT